MTLRYLHLAGVLGLAAALFAQTETATVSGLVMDPAGSAVGKAEITLVSVDRGTKSVTASNESGLYTFPVVQPGQYNLSVRKEGFKQVDLTGVIINVQDHIQQNFNLQIGSVSESVTVEGRTEQVNTTDASVGTVVDHRFVESLPLNGRSYQTLIQLSPGVVMVPVTTNGSDQGQFAVNGQRSNANYFTVDGVSANSGIPVFQGLSQGASGSLPATNIQGGFSNLVSVDALQEFKIQTSTFAPEYGRLPGGQISLVTRSGSNQYHGSLFEYFRNDKTDAKDWFDSRKPPLRFNDFGGTVSGPAFKDKTFFFFSYEGQRFLLPQPSVITVVPSEAQRAAATNSVAKMMLNAFPLPNGALVGTDGAYFTATYSNPNRMDAYSLRMDHHFNGKYSMFARYNRAPSNSLSRSSSNFSQASRFVQNTETLTVATTQVFTGSLVNDLRLNGTRQQGQWLNVYDGLGGGVRPDPTVLLPGYDTCGACYYLFYIYSLTATNSSLGGVTDGTTAKNESRSINVVDSLAYNVGKHQLKFGFDYRWFSPVQPGNGLILGYYFTNGIAGVNALTAPMMLASRSPKTVIVTPNYSSYAQDTWRVSQRLSLTYGFRWEINPPPHVKGSSKQIVTLSKPPDLSQLDQSGLQLAPLGTEIYPTNYHQFAPRVGAAYTLRQNSGHDTVVRAGWGMFYDLNSTPFAGGSWPYSASLNLQNQPVPATAAQVAIPAPNFTPSPTNRATSVNVAEPGFTAPRTYQWNFTLEQSLGEGQTITVSYVAAAGRDLLRTLQINFGTNATTPAAGVYWSPNFSTITYVTNQSSSDYHALQTQFRRRLAKGMQALGNYTWSHATDDNSSSSSITSPGLIYAPALNHGASVFDVRQNFGLALTYDVPVAKTQSAVNAILRNWSLNGILLARTGLPFDVKLNEITPFGSSTAFRRADLVPGASVWLSNPKVPGGKQLNAAAFQPPSSAFGQGSLGRNSIVGFGFWQADFGLHRSFHATERVTAELRLEAFNIFNHPNFTNPNSNLTYRNGVITVPATFGVSTTTLARGFGGGSNTGGFNPLFQSGGPRSMQIALRLRF